MLAKQRKASEQNNHEEDKVEDEFKQMITKRAKRLKKVQSIFLCNRIKIMLYFQLEEEESLSKPPKSQPILKKSQTVAGEEKMQQKSAVISEAGDKTVIEQKSEFERVFAQLRGEKREMVC